MIINTVILCSDSPISFGFHVSASQDTGAAAPAAKGRGTRGGKRKAEPAAEPALKKAAKKEEKKEGLNYMSALA